MDIKEFRAGFSQKQPTGYTSFQPSAINQSYTWANAGLNVLLEEATLRLGELNTFSHFVPDIDLFIRMHVVKEATVSSRIEGTRTEIGEALLTERNVAPERRDDWREVQNYIEAMNFAVDALHTLPLSNRLLRQTHALLMQGVRGYHKNPGEFRTSQNWIGGATLTDAVFIPPHHTSVPDLMGELEAFLHNTDVQVPHLIRIAIAHYQFETIHPFLDGNGRLGRLLIALYLVSTGVLSRPVLYLSDFFEKNKTLYYDNLTGVRQKNNLTQWLTFFLVAVKETCEKATTTLREVMRLKEECEGTRILSLGRRIPAARQLLNVLFSSPVLAAGDLNEALRTNPASANKLIADFERLGILKETTGFRRNRLFVFEEYLRLFQ